MGCTTPVSTLGSPMALGYQRQSKPYTRPTSMLIMTLVVYFSHACSSKMDKILSDLNLNCDFTFISFYFAIYSYFSKWRLSLPLLYEQYIACQKRQICPARLGRMSRAILAPAASMATCRRILGFRACAPLCQGRAGHTPCPGKPSPARISHCLSHAP